MPTRARTLRGPCASRTPRYARTVPGTLPLGTEPSARPPRDYKEQVFLFTRDFTVDWTNNVSERGAKAAKRHQAVSGYWHTLATLARWCRIRSYLDTAAAHDITALDAIRAALAGKPWLPPLPAVA